MKFIHNLHIIVLYQRNNFLGHQVVCCISSEPTSILMFLLILNSMFITCCVLFQCYILYFKTSYSRCSPIRYFFFLSQMMSLEENCALKKQWRWQTGSCHTAECFSLTLRPAFLLVVLPGSFILVFFCS